MLFNLDSKNLPDLQRDYYIVSLSLSNIFFKAKLELIQKKGFLRIRAHPYHCNLWYKK